jgi:putative transposase
MMKLSINVPEVRNFIKDLAETPGKFFEMIRYNVQESVGKYLSALMDAELSFYLGRERYERNSQGSVNYRNGSYHRHFTMKGVGGVTIRVPRDRNGTFQTSVLPKSRQYEDRIREDLSLMYLAGISTRALSLITTRLVGRSLCHNEVSRANAELTEGIEQWRNRDLSSESFKYIFVDGTNFKMRIHGSIELVPVLVAIGVAESGHKKVLGIQAGDKESASNWREFFKDLKRRGLNGSKVTLGIMDGLPALEKVFK